MNDRKSNSSKAQRYLNVAIWRSRRWLRKLPGQVWEGCKQNVVSLIVGAIFAVISFGLGFVWGLAFPAHGTTIANYDVYGAHCLDAFFKSAADDGARLTFEPPQLKNVMICGVPLSVTGSDIDTLPTVLEEMDKCFNAVSNGPRSWKVKANFVGETANGIAGDVASVTKPQETPYLTCRCPEGMRAILAEAKSNQQKPWCGLDPLPADTVLANLRNYRIQW